jgi:hypothetical protein
MSGNRPVPFSERTDPEVPIALSTDQVPAQIEQVTNRSMSTKESLRLPDRFELSHPSLPHPGRLMRLLYPIVGILAVVMNNVWQQIPMSNSIATHFVSHDLSVFAAMAS